MCRYTLFGLLYFGFLFSCQNKSSQIEPGPSVSPSFDWQGHRGARGLLPENTVEGFLKALEFPVKTLEMDVVISKDSQVVLSHEPWFSDKICSHPSGIAITQGDMENLLIYQMTYDSLQKYDCGRRGNPRFPEQVKRPSSKPTLAMVVEAVRGFCKQREIDLPFFNIELKSDPMYDGIKTPAPHMFTSIVLQEIDRLGILDRTVVQCFDFRVLKEVKKLKPSVVTAALVEEPMSVEEIEQQIGFLPEIYSPDFHYLTAAQVEKCHETNIKVIPWTVNKISDMKNMILLGVDGIITDYPDRIFKVDSRIK